MSDIGLYIILILMLIILLWLATLYVKSVKLEKRLAKFSIDFKKSKDMSFAKSFSYVYKYSVKKVSKFLYRNRIGVNRYKKYVKTFNSFTKSTDFLAAKIVTAFEFLIVVLISQLLLLQLIDIFTLIISLLIGYYILDVIFYIRYQKYYKELQEQFLDAIIIMNSAFKAGKNIVQAINIVGDELDNRIGYEFKKMSLEINCGLAIDVVFKRLSEKINLDEVKYLSSTLTVLSKTGGNIVKIFDSIERTLYSQKKLKQEYKALTSSSRLLTIVLMVVPLVFAFIISILNKGYFNILFTNVFGIILFIIMLLIYALYIYVVSKVLRVKI